MKNDIKECEWTFNTDKLLTKEDIQKRQQWQLDYGTHPDNAIRCASGNKWLEWCQFDNTTNLIQPLVYSVHIDLDNIYTIKDKKEATDFHEDWNSGRYEFTPEQGDRSYNNLEQYEESLLIVWEEFDTYNGFNMAVPSKELQNLQCEDPSTISTSEFWLSHYKWPQIFIWNPDCITSIELVCDMSPPEARPEARSKPAWHGYGM